MLSALANVWLSYNYISPMESLAINVNEKKLFSFTIWCTSLKVKLVYSQLFYRIKIVLIPIILLKRDSF